MGSGNGYVTLETLRGLKRREDDEEVEGIGKVRVQALSSEEFATVKRLSRIAVKDGDEQYDVDRDHQLTVAFGLANPYFGARDDLESARAEVAAIFTPRQLASLAAHISHLTWRPQAESYKSLFASAASEETEAATPSGTSS